MSSSVTTPYGPLEVGVRSADLSWPVRSTIGGLTIDGSRYALDADLRSGHRAHSEVREYRFVQRDRSASGICGAHVTDAGVLDVVDRLLCAVQARLLELSRPEVKAGIELIVELPDSGDAARGLATIATLLAEHDADLPSPGGHAELRGTQLVLPGREGDSYGVAALLARYAVAATVTERATVRVLTKPLPGDFTVGEATLTTCLPA